MQRLSLAVHGAAGRMGQRVTALTLADPTLRLAAAWEAASHPSIREDAGRLAGEKECGVVVSPPWSDDTPIDVVVDFSVPEAVEPLALACQERSVPLVIATTGLTEPQEAAIGQVAKSIPIVWAPSMSPAVNLAMKLCQSTAHTLGQSDQQVDVEILERHHRFKQDAPSGTALRFGKIIADEMGQTRHTHGRHGQTGLRPANEIGYHAIRVGDNPGEHTIVFSMLGETLEITVRASNRDGYAHGALVAAKFLPGRSPGLYTMWDVLG